MFKYVSIAIFMLVLAACSPADDSSNDTTIPATDDTTTTTDAQTTSDTDETASDDPEESTYSVVITGAEEFEFDNFPRYACVNNQVSITTITQAPKLDIYLPSNVQPGTYPLADFDANTDPTYQDGVAVISISGEAREGGYDFYFTNVDGELVIETMPTQIGERFVATLDGTLENSDGSSITVDGEFDLLNDGNLTMDCEY